MSVSLILIEKMLAGKSAGDVLNEAIVDLDSNNFKYDPAQHSEQDIIKAVKSLFQGVASDLGVDDMQSDEFQDFAGDRLSDAKVPDKVIKTVLKKIGN